MSPELAKWLNRAGTLLEFIGLWLAMVQFVVPHLRIFLGSSDAPTGAIFEWLYRVLLQYVSLDFRQ